MKKKICLECGKEYLPTGRCQKVCKACTKIYRAKVMRTWALKFRVTGVGSGRNQRGNKNPMWTGKRLQAYTRKLVIIRASSRCEGCGKDLSKYVEKAFNHKNGWWVIHHIDHDKTHNVETNLKLLCKRCHQITHSCWKNFFVKV